MAFPFGWPNFRGELLVSGRVNYGIITALLPQSFLDLSPTLHLPVSQELTASTKNGKRKGPPLLAAKKNRTSKGEEWRTKTNI